MTVSAHDWMPRDIVAVEPRGGYRLHLRFDDGVEGDVDLLPRLSFTGVFEPLKAQEYFMRVRVDQELGTICWPNNADLDADVLYALVTGRPIPDLE